MDARSRPPEDIAPLEFFSTWAPEAVAHDPARREKIEGLEARIQFLLDGDGEGDGAYWLAIREGRVHGDAGRVVDPDVTLETDVQTWRDLNAGRIKAPTAVMKKRLRFRGSMYLALRIHFVIG